MMNIANVLVATDFGPASDTAMTYAREFARTFGARLHVLHVVDDAATYAGPEAIGVDLARLQVDLNDVGQVALNRVVTGEDRSQLRAVSVIRPGSSIAFEIVRYAGEQDVDLIVIGTHGRGIVRHLVMGSVAEKVVRAAPCPVLTVRHLEHDFVQPDAVQGAADSKLDSDAELNLAR
jgi:nucleotide-binding universal stress UspA family protein